jgi:cytochrome P450
VFNSIAALRGKTKPLNPFLLAGLIILIRCVHTDIYKNDKTTKPQAYIALGPGLTTYNIFTAVDNDLHRVRRQLVGQVLTDKSMRTFEPTMIEQVDIFVQNLQAESANSKPVNISKKVRQLGINIAVILAFGYDLRLQTDDENQFIQTVLDSGTWASNVSLQYPLIRKLHLGILMMLPLFKLRENYLGLLETMIKSRTAQPNDAKHDLYSFVASAFTSEAGGLRNSDLWSEANLFLSAGQWKYCTKYQVILLKSNGQIAGETVKTAATATFFYLSQNPAAYEKVISEIRTTFNGADKIDGPGLANCTYLRACIDESLRLSPPVPGILWRDVIRDGKTKGTPFVVDGHVIPEGTIIGVNTYSIHHNATYFPDPFSFRPDRWLNTSSFSPQTRSIMRDAFAPFSMGPRGCAGKSMAYLETSLTIAKTLWCLDFRVATEKSGEFGSGKLGYERSIENPDEFQLYDVLTASHDGPYLDFKARGQSWKSFDRCMDKTKQETGNIAR